MILLGDILIIVGLSVVVLYLCFQMRVPIIVGFLFTGVVTGPHGLGLVRDIESVKILADVGVVLLLFTIGLEFSFRNLLQVRRPVLLGGALQVSLTILIAFAISRYFGQTIGESLLIGFLVSLSSTAIVMKFLQDRAEVETPQGNTALGILIFQDIIIVPMMLCIPLLAGEASGGTEALLLFLAKVVFIIALVFTGAKWIVPRVFFSIANTRSRELFLLSVIAICLAVAWLTHMTGLSLALGAFLAGLIISESEYSHQAFGNVLPFRDVFMSFFFVSVGMLLNMGFFIEHYLSLSILAFAVMAFKALVAGLVSVFLGLPLRTAILVGASLSQVGEFSFILSEKAIQHGLLTGDMNQGFLALSVLTMMATPLALSAAPRIASFVLELPLPRKIKKGSYPATYEEKVHIKDHLIIVGFGLNGRNLARAAKFSGIPYVITEMNPTVVREERAKGEPIYYGDATQEAILQHVNIKAARALVVVINDPAATRRITELARRLNPKLYLVVRTRFLQEMVPLSELGADEVIPEEFETSVEIFSRVLAKYLMPKEEIEKFVTEIRLEHYEMLRSLSREATSCLDIELCLPDVEIKTFRIAEGSPFIGKTLAQTEMRKKMGVSLLALRRKGEVVSNPAADTVFHAGDILFVVGEPNQIKNVIRLFNVPNRDGSADKHT
ncbi:MAG: potassium transporter KefB [Deltaproteobacteria bacterium]|nr:potassium transporter KefB [Deltaproteobacteria bacterium]